MIVRAASPATLAAMHKVLGLPVQGDFKAIEAVDDKGVVQGVVAYDKWTLNATRIHVLMRYPIRALLRPAFSYPFLEAGKGVLIAEIAESNKKSRRLAHRLGFTEVARIGDGWAVDDDLIIYTLRRAKWLDEED